MLNNLPKRFIEDEQGGLVVSVQELDIDDVLHGVSRDHLVTVRKMVTVPYHNIPQHVVKNLSM